MAKTKKTNVAETAILLLVCLVAFVSIYYLYKTVGAAYLSPVKIDKVVIPVPQFCCCMKTNTGDFFEVWKDIPKEADEFKKTALCKELCEEEYSTASNPATLLKAETCNF